MLAAGEMIGAYQVINEIGHGGTGVVYLAWHLNLQKYVVLKRLNVRAGEMDFLRREADILKNLRHQNLPQIYDFVVRSEEVFTVMDYIAGEDLSKLAKGAENLPESLLINWMKQMAEVLQYLHTREMPVIHSDIKPENIIRTPDGTLCLIDFNISSAGLNERGVKGYSKYFASPEQRELAAMIRQRGEGAYELDSRTDIYSLGATFYYLITGRVSDGTHPLPSLEVLQPPGYSSMFCRIIDRCMAWNRNNRYKDAGKLLRDLNNLRRQDVRWRRFTLVRSACLLVATFLTASGIYCVLHGVSVGKRQDYAQAYGQFAACVNVGDDAEAEKAAIALLNEHESLLKKDPQVLAGVYEVLGDIYSNRGESTYLVAADYYHQAIALKKDKNLYLKAARIDLELNRTAEVKQLLDEAEGGLGYDIRVSLQRAELYRVLGDAEACGAEVDKILLSDGEDLQSCAEACKIAVKAFNAAGNAEKAQYYEERYKEFQDRQ